ncbi:hypothetical protein BDV93DRAFT_566374, partial [Ceratobasidium sp. AG-I]
RKPGVAGVVFGFSWQWPPRSGGEKREGPGCHGIKYSNVIGHSTTPPLPLNDHTTRLDTGTTTCHGRDLRPTDPISARPLQRVATGAFKPAPSHSCWPTEAGHTFSDPAPWPCPTASSSQSKTGLTQVSPLVRTRYLPWLTASAKPRSAKLTARRRPSLTDQPATGRTQHHPRQLPMQRDAPAHAYPRLRAQGR